MIVHMCVSLSEVEIVKDVMVKNGAFLDKRDRGVACAFSVGVCVCVS